MPFSRKSAEPAKGSAQGSAGPQGQVVAKQGSSDLLIRFFESDWFDCFIALTYLYKSNSQGVQDYLCNRLYGLPEQDVERYLSQLTQLCIQQPGSSLARAIVDLCAQSLRIAVKAYWLLLAISQDQPKEAHVAALRDACEQAGLEGHWQLPFKQTRLPAPLIGSPSQQQGPFAGAFGSGQRTPLRSPSGAATPLLSMSRAASLASPDPQRPGSEGQPLSPHPGMAGGGASSARPLSPDGLGGGLYSSVFMDTGVEGLIYGGSPAVAGLLQQRQQAAQQDLRAVRQHVPGSPRASQGSLLQGPGHPLLPAPGALDSHAQRVSSLQQELGAGEGVSALLMRSMSAGDDGGPGVVLSAEAEWSGSGGSSSSSSAGAAAANAIAALLSPPNSPHRRQTTFGATLDFVETLCQASSSLTAFQPEDRQWALRRALQQINVEIEKATRSGVTIWFPMGDSNLRVVRLAYRESRLLNSREKAPFTLCVEVLDEQKAAAIAAAAETHPAKAAAAAGGGPAAAVGASAAAGSSASSYADSAKSLLAEQGPLPLLPPSFEDDAAAAAAAAEAAAIGIPFVANHHRTQSMDTTGSSSGSQAGLEISASSSSLDVAALAAVQGSSAVSGDAVAAAEPSPSQRHGSTHAARGSPRDSVLSAASSDQLHAEPSLAGMLAGPETEGVIAATAGSGMQDGSPPPRPRRLARELDAVSATPSSSEPGSPLLRGQASPPGTGSDLQGRSSPRSLRFDHQPPAAQQQQQQQLPTLRLPLSPCGKLPGAGTWIGSSGSPVAARRPDAAGSRGALGGGGRRSGMAGGSLEAALAGLRGEAPLVRVQLEVLNDRPLSSSARSSNSSDAGMSAQAPAADGASSAERRRASLDAASRVQHQCDRSSWACKLGLCKLCNSKLATMDDAPWLQPHVKLHLTVQGGVDLTIRKTPARHHRMPSHEAILKVAKQHKLPPPALPAPLAAPRPQEAVPPQQVRAQQQQQSPQEQEQEQQRLGALAAGGACMPVFRPAAPASSQGGSSLPQSPAAASEEIRQRREAAEAAYGEPWQARKERVQLSSPHGRRPGWDLRCVIVKTGDDCRQELLAMQLIRTFHEIFGEAQLPLWLRPYEVLPTSNRTALIEMVANAPSIHALKCKSPPGASLRDHLAAKFGAGTPAFLRAQRCFVESLAAYSLICYLLQIKDRHNGNILLDDEGHLIHIDFGFMLTNSPGGVNFESAPFKLTRELLEVMDSDSEGRASELFDYFKVLMIQGFLAVRKHADRIMLLVEMMQGSGCPCFKNRVTAVQGLKKRMHLALPEPQVVEVVLSLISDSLDAWRTRQYDYYQRVLNGIL